MLWLVQLSIRHLVAKVGAAPKYLVSDHGPQFCADGFKDWCKRRNIRQRLGAVGKPGSIAVLERMVRTLKDECTRLLAIVSLLRPAFRRELELFIAWYNGARPTRWTARRLMNATSDNSPLAASRALSRDLAGHAPRPAPRRERSSKADRAYNCKCTSILAAAAVIFLA